MRRALVLNDIKRLLKFASRKSKKVVSKEDAHLEFKKAFNWGNREEYAETIAAFSNREGGYIIFGVDPDSRELCGLTGRGFTETDEAVITQYLNSILSPDVEIERATIDFKGIATGVLFIHPCDSKPVIATKTHGKIREGDIFYRYSGVSTRVRFAALRGILEEIKDKERQQWTHLLERMTKVGAENVAILNTARGKIEDRGGTLVIDEKLLSKMSFIKEGNFKRRGKPVLKLVGDVKPVSFVTDTKTHGGVRLTSDLKAPAVRFDEEAVLKEFPWDSNTLVKEMRNRYWDFLLNAEFHKIKRDIASKGYCMTRKLNPKSPRSATVTFYSPSIMSEFDKHYSRKSKKS